MKSMLIRCVPGWFQMSFVQNAFSRILFGSGASWRTENIKVLVLSRQMCLPYHKQDTESQETRKTENLWFHTLNKLSDPLDKEKEKVVYIVKHAQYTAFNYTYRCGEVVINSRKNKLLLSWKHNWMVLEVERSSVPSFVFKLPKNENAYCWNILRRLQLPKFMPRLN